MIKVKINEFNRPVLVIDDNVYDSRDANFLLRDESGKFYITILEDNLIGELIKHRVSNFSEEIEVMHFYASSFRMLQDAQDISQGITFFKNDLGEPCIGLNFYFSPENWKHLWSIREYQAEFKQVFEQGYFSDTVWMTAQGAIMIPDGFTIKHPVRIAFPIQDISATIEEEAYKHQAAINQLHKLTEASLLGKLRQESVVMHFSFPDGVKVACEQYLLYFTQFLKDLGVEADTALTHEAGQVLFAVTPDDKEQALDKIRAALEVYLHLPSSPVSDIQQGEIAILRLNSELQNFQSKLSLARAEIQMKDAAIQLQKVTIAQLSGEVVFDSLKDVTPKAKDKDKEELVGDIVSLIPIKGKGFEVNLPELFRKLKQLFKDKE